MVDFDFFLGLRTSVYTTKLVQTSGPGNVVSAARTIKPIGETGLTALVGGGGNSPAPTMPPPGIPPIFGR